MVKNKSRVALSVSVFLFVLLMLSMVQIKVETKMLLLERLIPYGGWIEILLLALYGAFVAWNMWDVNKSSKWRIVTWTVFSAWFFLQLFMGIVVSDVFLLSGKLHLPIPAMIIGGPVYRWQISIMTLLFLSTAVLSGPSWCSHLCYFGAMDGLISKRSKFNRKDKIKYRAELKFAIVVIVIATALILRITGISSLYSTLAGLLFGIIGLAVILFLSRKRGKMIHCTVFCPVGTIVNYFSKISPFRLKIDTSCTNCMACTPTCRYDALSPDNIKNRKPGITCTLCGDCVSNCHVNSFKYSFAGVKPGTARILYLFITISLHAIFMGMGRI